jgi:hypothetical protein
MQSVGGASLPNGPTDGEGTRRGAARRWRQERRPLGMELSTAAAVERLATVSSNRRRSESIGEHASGAYGCKTFTRLMRENCNEEGYCNE